MTRIKMSAFVTLICFTALCSFTNNQIASSGLVSNSVLGRYHAVGTIHLSGGCTVSYDAWIDYTLIPPGINSIHGSVTLSGSCSGSQTFRSTADVAEDKTITNVVVEFSDSILNSEEFAKALEVELNSFELFK